MGITSLTSLLSGKGTTKYNIDRVYLEDFSDGFYQIVIEIEEDK